MTEVEIKMIIDVCEGHPGALDIMNNIIEKYPSKLHLVLTMLTTKNIRGCNIYILYKSYGKDLDEFIREITTGAANFTVS